MSSNAKKEQEQKAPSLPREIKKTEEMTLEEEMAMIPEKRPIDEKMRFKKEEALLFGTPGHLSDKATPVPEVKIEKEVVPIVEVKIQSEIKVPTTVPRRNITPVQSIVHEIKYNE
jgi:hypothetical protein